MNYKGLSFIIYHLSFSAAIFSAALALTACTDNDDATPGYGASDAGEIHIGGVSLPYISATQSLTRADDPEEEIDEETVARIDAEKVSWLIEPLTSGLDITYGRLTRRTETERVAQLKLLTDDSDNILYSEGGLAMYSFLYRDNENGNVTDVKAKWYDNGAHFFEGVYVPEEIQFASTGSTTDVNGATGSAPYLQLDQHNDNTTKGSLGNYTLLSHYLGMPSNFTINATVGRIKLPFRHRLARVLAYILIDPAMGNDITLKGYMKDDKDIPTTTEDPSTTSIRFCNVKVLAGVKDYYEAAKQHHTYTPQWTETRKAIPHFVGERGSYDDSKNESYDDDHFIAYYNTDKKTYIYPTDAEWKEVHKHKDEFVKGTDGVERYDKYERTQYGKVPVYDLIVRPTYSSPDRVMYDEENVDDEDTKSALYAAKNWIDFELTLSNGLVYEKRFIFDLNANDETVVYLHISRERVDYNSSGSDLWIETIGEDKYYGVNNQNGNTLSPAGSSWQRAYTNKNQEWGVTDGHLYKYDTEDNYAQYVDDARWIEMLREAHKGGLHHGDYFILDQDIEIPAAAFPEGFVFTGHLDGQDHTITITDETYTAVTQRATDAYVDYVDVTGSEDKYVKIGNSYYANDALHGLWYERQVSPLGVVSYVLIPDITRYAGEYAYLYLQDDEDDLNDPPTNDDNEYTEWKFYKRILKEEKTEVLPVRTAPYSLFSGLDGVYSTPQESNIYTLKWEANVHREVYNGTEYWVPYKNGTTDGWRAEIINTNFNIPAGNKLFSDNAAITGHLRNCWVNGSYSGTPPKWSSDDTRTPEDHIPQIPRY